MYEQDQKAYNIYNEKQNKAAATVTIQDGDTVSFLLRYGDRFELVRYGDRFILVDLSTLE